MITIDKFVIREHEAEEFILPENFATLVDYKRERAWAKDFKLLKGTAVVGCNGEKKQMQVEYRIVKECLNDHPKEVRRAAFQSLMAHLADTILENNGGEI